MNKYKRWEIERHRTTNVIGDYIVAITVAVIALLALFGYIS